MTRHRPTRRAITIAIVAGLLFLAASTAQAGWLFVLAAGVLGLLGASLITRHDLSSAEVQRSGPTRTPIGEAVTIRLSLTNVGRRTLPLLRLTDRFPAFTAATVTAPRLRRGQAIAADITQQAERRGVYEWGPVEVVAGAPFGFLVSRRLVEVPTNMIVVPSWVDLRSFPILEPSSFPADVLHERARTGAGQEYLGVREYRPGDPPRSVHWRSTARVGRLVVREYEEEIQSRVALVVGGSDAGTPPDSAFEALVSAAASVAIYALVTGHPVDLVRTEDDDGGVSHLGGPDRFALLDWLAAAEPHDGPLTPAVSHVLPRMGRRGTVVLLAPTVGQAGRDLASAVRAIQLAGSRAIVIAARSTSWSSDVRLVPIQEEEVLRGLQGGRASIRVISKGDELSHCLL